MFRSAFASLLACVIVSCTDLPPGGTTTGGSGGNGQGGIGGNDGCIPVIEPVASTTEEDDATAAQTAIGELDDLGDNFDSWTARTCEGLQHIELSWTGPSELRLSIPESDGLQLARSETCFCELEPDFDATCDTVTGELERDTSLTIEVDALAIDETTRYNVKLCPAVALSGSDVSAGM